MYSRNTIVTLPDTSEMSVAIQIHEADIEKLEVGMKAVVTSETAKGQSFEGTIAHIDSVANAGNRWSGNNIRKFNVAVQVTGQNLALRPGTSARVEILVGEATDVLYVPLQTINAREGRLFCYVEAGGKIQAKRVRLGRSNETHVEVVSGVSEGDLVLLYDPELPDAD